MACWVSLHSVRFAASIAGGATTGLHGEAQIKDESYVIALASKTYGARTTWLDKRPDTMDTPQYAPNHTSSDLLFSLDSERARQSLNYEIVAQSTEEVQDTQNAPAVSMGPYLIESGQTQLLTTISIYSQRRESREQIRLLYMNAVALRVWKAMGKRPSLIGAQHRPPRNALLAFGVPFCE
jgi:hypothetical protein